jgi:signal transduction histidine kinase
MKFADLSLRWKVPLRVMGAVFGTTFVFTVALVAREYDDTQRALEGYTQSLARVLADTLVTPVLHDDIWRAYEILRSVREPDMLGPDRQAELFIVSDADARVFVANRPEDFPVGSDLAASKIANPELNDVLRGESLDQRVVTSGDQPYRIVTAPLVSDGVILGHVLLGYSKRFYLPRLVDLIRRALLVTVLVLALVLPVSWIWAQRTARPLLDLAHAMSHVPHALRTALAAPLPATGDEVGQLGTSFKRMIEELLNKQALEQQMVASERLAAVGRLSAGIAHEINNPLGGMLTAIRTHRRHEGDRPLNEQTLSLLERGLSQIRNTVAALLVETKTEDRLLEPSDIDDLIILADAEAHARSVRLLREGGIDGPLPLPASLVRQIVLNLLLNAIQAAGTGGTAVLSIGAEAGKLLLEVRNDGTHIPEEQLGYLFEPFVSGRTHGYGLGLWVVYQIVQQLGGGLSVASEPGRTVFTIEIPYEMPA